MKYRRKPTVIEAVQFTGPDSFAAIRELAGHWASLSEGSNPDSCGITTPNGWVPLVEGDWVIKGTAPGDFYPCKADVFAATYEPVGESKTNNGPTPGNWYGPPDGGLPQLNTTPVT